MKTITIKINKTITEEKELSLPLFRKDTCHTYKVFSENKCISVCHGLDSGLSINVAHADLAWNNEKTLDCSEAEFIELYEKTEQALKEKALSEVAA